MSAIETIAVGRLKVADDNIRQDVGDVSELAASIKAGGVLQPLLVREGDLLVVAGARRLAAAKKAGLSEVPVLVRAFTEQERLEAMIVENLQRDDLTPLEEAAAFQRLVDEMKLTQREIASRVGRAQSHVAKRLALLALPEKVQKAVDSGGITLPDAQELAKIKDDPKLVEKLAKKGSTTNGYGRGISAEVEAAVQKREREKKHAAAVAALVKKGVTVVDAKSDAYGYQLTLPAGVVAVQPHVYSGKDVEMDPKKHAKLACHAIAVHPHSLKQIEVCTDPSEHPSKAEQLKTAQEKRDAEIAARQKAFDEMTGRRRQFVREAVKARIDKDALLELAYLALMHDGNRYYGNSSDEIAVDLLGLEPATADQPKDDTVEVEELEPMELLEREAAKSATARLRVTFAVAAAAFETDLGVSHGWGDETSYFEWLTRHGYKPTAEEKALLEG